MLSASRLEDVLPALASAEAAATDGRWVAGFVAYDAAPAFDPAYRVKGNGSFPLLWFGVFDRPMVLDGVDAEFPPQGTMSLEDRRGFRLGEWVPDVDAAEYGRAIATIRQAAADGAVYQVNYTLRLRAPFSGAPLGLHKRFQAAQGPAYAAYLDLGRFCVLSASPELFFERRGLRVTCRPMKGTAPRGRWMEEDVEAKRRLLESEKDRAENAMIVDLVRNDLGRISEFGSIQAQDVFKVETYPTVHQMTSTVSGTVRTGTSLTDLFRAVFPCGSVTGAPKIASTGFISGLEKAPRGLYCGAIGYIEPGGDCVFNVPIRTVVVDRARGEAEYGVGGGITWDSSPDGEYAEVLTKAEILRAEWPAFSLLETLRANDLGPVRLEHHLARMEASAVYFGFPYSASYVRASVACSDGAEAAAEKRKASVRAKVEHPFLYVKRRFGYAPSGRPWRMPDSMVLGHLGSWILTRTRGGSASSWTIEAASVWRPVDASLPGWGHPPARRGSRVAPSPLQTRSSFTRRQIERPTNHELPNTRTSSMCFS